MGLSPRTQITSVPSAMHSHRAFGGRQEIDTRALTISTPSSEVTVHVSFNESFSMAPKVMVMPVSGPTGGEFFIVGSINNVTADGFDVTFASLSGQPATGSGTFTYQAFGN